MKIADFPDGAEWVQVPRKSAALAADTIEELARRLEHAVQQHNACEQELRSRSPKAWNALRAKAERDAAVLEALTTDGAIDVFNEELPGVVRHGYEATRFAIQAALQHAQEQVDND